MKKSVIIAAMICISGITFGQDSKNTSTPNDLQQSEKKVKSTDVSAKNKTHNNGDSMEGKYFKIKLTAKETTGMNTAPGTGTSAMSPGVAGKNDQAMNSSQMPDGQAENKMKQQSILGNGSTNTVDSKKNSAGSTATTTPADPKQQNNTTISMNPDEVPEATIEKEENRTDAAGNPAIQNENTKQTPAGMQADLNKSKDASMQENTAGENSKSAYAPGSDAASLKSFENKTLIITLKNGVLEVSGNEETGSVSCPYHVTSGSGSLATFTASCTDPGRDREWWSGFINDNSIHGTLSVLSTSGQTMNYQFTGSKTTTSKKRNPEKETSLR